MKKVRVEQLKPGMRFSKPVYIDRNNMLIGANVSIRENDLKRLDKWGITEVETDGDLVGASNVTEKSTGNNNELAAVLDNYNSLVQLKEQLLEVHDKACKTVQKTHTAIRNGRIFPTTDIENIAEDIYNIVHRNHNVFLFLYGDDIKNDAVAVHAVNTTFYAILIGITMKYSKVKLKDLGIGCLMINSGMVQIPAYIMHKQSDLTEREQNQIRTHPILGYQALKKFGNFPEPAAMISMQHHERLDGKGYPRGLKGNDISEFARIAMIADSYEALLERRSYREQQFFYDAMKSLVSDGARKFDPVILRLFINILSIYPIGSIVQLNKKGTGIVIGSVPNKPLRPIVKLVKDENGNRIRDLEVVNLLEDNSLYIVKSMDEKESGIKLGDEL